MDGIISSAIALIVLLVVIDHSTSRDGDSVAVIGDSITVLDTGDLQHQLSSDFKLTVSARGGLTIGKSMAAAQLLAASKPSQVIIDLGSNDALSAVSLAQAQTDLHTMVGLFKEADCIHLVNVNTHMAALGRGPVATEANQLNDEMRKIAAANSAVDIIDWDKIISDDIADHPPKGTLTGDTIHPGSRGQQLLADEADAVLHRCGRPWQFW